MRRAKLANYIGGLFIGLGFNYIACDEYEPEAGECITCDVDRDYQVVLDPDYQIQIFVPPALVGQTAESICKTVLCPKGETCVGDYIGPCESDPDLVCMGNDSNGDAPSDEGPETNLTNVACKFSAGMGFQIEYPFFGEIKTDECYPGNNISLPTTWNLCINSTEDPVAFCYQFCTDYLATCCEFQFGSEQSGYGNAIDAQEICELYFLQPEIGNSCNTPSNFSQCIGSF